MDSNPADALPNLPLTGWAVLGMLSFDEELSGYDVKKWADWSLRFFYWSPSFSQVYSELRRLEACGLASSREMPSDGGRPRRAYRITEAGQAAVARWTAEAPVEPPVLKHGVMLRLWLGHLSDPEHLREMLLEHREQSEQMRRSAAEHAQGAHRETSWAYPELALKWSELYYAQERDRIDVVLADLEKAAARSRPDRFPGFLSEAQAVVDETPGPQG